VREHVDDADECPLQLGDPPTTHRCRGSVPVNEAPLKGSVAARGDILLFLGVLASQGCQGGDVRGLGNSDRRRGHESQSGRSPDRNVRSWIDHRAVSGLDAMVNAWPTPHMSCAR
jgi:hypothetical protein